MSITTATTNARHSGRTKACVAIGAGGLAGAAVGAGAGEPAGEFRD
jgi:hypothetical protein